MRESPMKQALEKYSFTALSFPPSGEELAGVEGSSEEGAAEESGGTEPSSELTASDEFTAESSV